MKIRLIQGDITILGVDAIVNAANSTLLGGGGVDGAIHRAGGPEILKECIEITRRQGGCAPGQAVLTIAGLMKAKYVIHTVGPIWNGGNFKESELLADCYRNSLQIADDEKLESIAFPNISTGAYGFPKSKAAEIAISTVSSYQSRMLKEVIFVCFDQENFSIYKDWLNKIGGK